MHHSLVTRAISEVRWLLAGSSAGYFISYGNAEFSNLPWQWYTALASAYTPREPSAGQTCFLLTLISARPLATAAPHLLALRLKSTHLKAGKGKGRARASLNRPKMYVLWELLSKISLAFTSFILAGFETIAIAVCRRTEFLAFT